MAATLLTTLRRNAQQHQQPGAWPVATGPERSGFARGPGARPISALTPPSTREGPSGRMQKETAGPSSRTSCGLSPQHRRNGAIQRVAQFRI
jgi:hypothetical protein